MSVYKITTSIANTRIADTAKRLNMQVSFLTSYTGQQQKVQYKCNMCGTQGLSSFYHFTKILHGCKRCRKRVSLHKLNFLLQRHANKNNLAIDILTKSTPTSHRVNCFCLQCKKLFQVRISGLLYRGDGCKRCRLLKTQKCQMRGVQDAIKQLHESLDGYMTFTEPHEYTGIYQVITCWCNKCKEQWDATFHKIVNLGYKCPNHCHIAPKYISQPEYKIIAHIRQHYPNLEIQQSVRSLIRNLKGTHAMEVDIYIPELKLAFEFNGTYWHSDEMIQQRTKGKFTTAQQYHDYKTQACAKQGIRLVHIDESEWVENKQLTLSLISSLLMESLQ